MHRRRCVGSAYYVLLTAYNYAGVLLVAATFLMWKMRNVRKQVKENGRLGVVVVVSF